MPQVLGCGGPQVQGSRLPGLADLGLPMGAQVAQHGSKGIAQVGMSGQEEQVGHHLAREHAPKVHRRQAGLRAWIGPGRHQSDGAGNQGGDDDGEIPPEVFEDDGRDK